MIEDEHSQMVKALSKDGGEIVNSLTAEKAHVWHMASCVGGEAGELFDAVKKWIVYEKQLDRENVVEELGDLEFYLEGVRQGLNISREETLEHNINKLLKGKNARYKNGNYSNEAAQNREDKQ